MGDHLIPLPISTTPTPPSQKTMTLFTKILALAGVASATAGVKLPTDPQAFVALIKKLEAKGPLEGCFANLKPGFTFSVYDTEKVDGDDGEWKRYSTIGFDKITQPIGVVVQYAKKHRPQVSFWNGGVKPAYRFNVRKAE